ncbi:hypothetical protein [Singulisphaera sp. PoT]|uniref:hypothetical protein n=1 Tax=Singulisphaera sp. PoT TaxID=3411797 RepID=UPI003BF4BEFB
MVLSDLSSYAEILVILFQLVGVISLCVCRLVPPGSTKWVSRARAGFVLAMVGLGFAGAICGRQDSEFALFAGGTMTVLLIGMTVGSGHAELGTTRRAMVAAEPKLAS